MRYVHYFLITMLLCGAGCATHRFNPRDARYEPYTSILEIASDIRRHEYDDTYRFALPRDPSGQPLYKASLRRLRNYEQLYPGKFEEVVDYCKGLCRERLHDYAGAITCFETVSQTNSPLAKPAEGKVAILSRFQRLATRPVDQETISACLDAMRQTIEEWNTLAEEVRDSPYEALAQEEAETAEVELAEFAARNYALLENGVETALDLHRRCTITHAGSKNLDRHYLRWADFCAELSRQYVREVPPDRLKFDTDAFLASADAAIRLYSVVAQKDGAPERLEALGRLQAFNAYVARILSEGE